MEKLLEEYLKLKRSGHTLATDNARNALLAKAETVPFDRKLFVEKLLDLLSFYDAQANKATA